MNWDAQVPRSLTEENYWLVIKRVMPLAIVLRRRLVVSAWFFVSLPPQCGNGASDKPWMIFFTILQYRIQRLRFTCRRLCRNFFGGVQERCQWTRENRRKIAVGLGSEHAKMWAVCGYAPSCKNVCQSQNVFVQCAHIRQRRTGKVWIFGIIDSTK